MKRISSIVTHVVERMTDPKPTFVSLVEHGANQTPFKVVKTNITSMTPETQRFVFKKDKFATEEAVKGYLAAKGFADATIQTVDETFVCIHRDEGDFTEVKEIQCEDGVSQFVGVLKEAPAQKSERQRSEPTTPTAPAPEAPAAKSEETPPVQPVATLKTAGGEEMVKKFDSWVAYYGGQITLEDALKKATEADGNVPIGYNELRNVFDDVIRNNLKSDNLGNLEAVALEFVAGVKKLHGLFAVAKAHKSDAQEMVSKALFGAESNPSAETPPAATQKTEGNPSETPPAPEQPETPPAPTPEPETPPAPQPETPPAQPPAEDPVMKAVNAALAGFSTKLEEALAPIRKSLEDTTKRVEGLETPTRKSADETELPPPAGDKGPPPAQPDSSKKAKKGWDNGSGVGL